MTSIYQIEELSYFMKFLKFNNQLLLGLLFCLLPAFVFSQKMTKIKGTVVDADSKDPIMFANIAFVGTHIGTETDMEGNFEIETKFASDQIQVTYVGYETQTIPIEKGEKQVLNISLSSSSIKLQEIVIKDKGKVKYSNKNNPAVELIKNVIEHKADNRISSQDFYEYDKYEKIEFDLNNFDPEKMKKRRAFKKFQFLFFKMVLNKIKAIFTYCFINFFRQKEFT